MSTAAFKLQLGTYCYNLMEQQLYDEHHVKVLLRHQSWQVLHYLALHANQVVTKAELFNSIWKNHCVTDDSLVQCIAEIRRVLNDPQHEIVKTVARRGYLLVTQPPSKNHTNIPEDLLPFLGRTKELNDLQALLLNPACRLVNIMGLGGVGKSRLAKALARKCNNYFKDGIYFIELTAVNNSDLIAHAIAKKLNVTLQGLRPPIEQLQLSLANQVVLLILDNIEHLIPDTSICLDLLEVNPYLKIITTSRLPLNIYGEWIYTLQGLPVVSSIQAINHDNCAALELFVQAAQRFKHDFRPTHSEINIILAICQLVEGLPLGIEMAASWVKYLSCSEILSEMQQYLTTANNTLGKTDTSTLDTLLAQTWSLLNSDEQNLMQVLALFRGAFTRQAALSISRAQLSTCHSLMDKAILVRTPEGKYQVHEVMRHYANNRRSYSINDQSIKHFVGYYLELAYELDHVILGADQLNAIMQLEQEHNNFRECLTLCATTSQLNKSNELGLNLVGALGVFWFLASHWQEGYQQAQRFLSTTTTNKSSLSYAKGLFTMGGIAVVLDQHTIAEAYLPLSIDIAMNAGHKNHAARSLIALGVLRRLQQQYELAIQCGEQSMQLFGDLQNLGGYQFNLANVGHSLLCMGRYDEGVKALEECLQLNQNQTITVTTPYVLVNLGRLHYKLKQFETARTYLKQGITVADQLRNLLYRAQALCLLGWIEIVECNYNQALLWLKMSFTDYLHLGDKEGQVEVLNALGVLKALLNELKLAWQFFVMAEDLKMKARLKENSDNVNLIAQTRMTVQRYLAKSELNLYQNLARSIRLEEVLTLL